VLVETERIRIETWDPKNARWLPLWLTFRIVQDYDCSDVDYALYAGPTDDEELDKGDFEVRFPSRESDSTGIHAANRCPIQQPGNVVRGLSPAKGNGKRNPGQQSWGRRHEEESVERGRPAKKSRMSPRGSCSPTSDAGDGMDGAGEYGTEGNGTEMNGNEDNRGEVFYVKDSDTGVNDTEDNDTENNDTEENDSEENDTEENATEENDIIASLHDTITSSNNTNASLRNKDAYSRNTIASWRPIVGLPDEDLWDLFYNFEEPFIPEAYLRVGRCLQNQHDWAKPVPPSLLKSLRKRALRWGSGDRVRIWEHSDWQMYCRNAMPAERKASPESDTTTYESLED